MVTDAKQLPGIDPSWVRTYNVERQGVTETFAVLETAPENPLGTIVCVHGNPTWSYLWRNFVRELGTSWRIIAIDQLGMGFSSRSDGVRTLSTRIDDLDALLSAANVAGPVTLIAHDWGGPVSMGWASQHPDRVESLVLFNTGTTIPTTGVPGLIQVSRTPLLRRLICSQTKAFINGAVLPTGGITRAIRRVYCAPYSTVSRRRAIADFVADIPTDSSHVSYNLLRSVADGVQQVRVPTLLMWGVSDFVFHTGVLADMQQTFPHADTITLETGHLSPEHSEAPSLVRQWLENTKGHHDSGVDGTVLPQQMSDLNAAVRRRAESTPSDTAVFNAEGNVRTTWQELQVLIQNARAGLRAHKACAGDRVAILAPFDERTIAFIYACWAEGVVPVVADPGLGIKNMRRALRESHPQFVLTQRATRIASRVLHLAYRAERLDVVDMTSFKSTTEASTVEVQPDSVAAVLYTSGATGAAKGVVYTHRQLCALAYAIQKQFAITDADGIAAAYIPFALYGPAWGVGVGLPKVNVLAPGKLSAKNLQVALNGVHGTILFAAPAPLKNVVKGNIEFPTVRCVMSAGAPVGDALLQQARKSFVNADFFSPYGMTEMLIVSDGVRGESTSVRGVPVGQPLPDVNIMILPFGWKHGDNVTPLPHGETGEVFVSGPWLSRGYDQHWRRNRDARLILDNREWHRTGDVGHIDGGVFIEGRIAHVIHINDEVITPVPIEQAIENLLPDVMAAAVGARHKGEMKLVVVLSDGSTTGVADSSIKDRINELFPSVDVVLFKKELPVDRRHNSKIDRTLLATWASEQLAKQ